MSASFPIPMLVTPAWLSGCLEALRVPPDHMTRLDEATKSAVYTRYLQDDLALTSQPCLPVRNSEDPFGVWKLEGWRVLQILNVKNVCLQTVQSYDNEELEKVNRGDLSKGRVLKATLTDGNTLISAVEQRPIPFLSVSTLPGTKVLIGGVVCAAGALLLNDTNCFLLGGSIPVTEGAPSSTRPTPSPATLGPPTNHHHNTNSSSSSSSNRTSGITASRNDNRAAPLGQPPPQTKPSAVEMEFDEFEIDDLAWEAIMTAPSHNSISTSSSTSAVRSRAPPAVSKVSSVGAGPTVVVDLTGAKGESGRPLTFLPPPPSAPQPPAKPLMSASGDSALSQRSVSPPPPFPRLFPPYPNSTTNVPSASTMRAPQNSNYISPVNVKDGGSGNPALDSAIVSSLPSSGSGSGSVTCIVPSPWAILSDLTEGTQRVHGLVVDTAGKLRVTDNQYVVNLVVMDSSGVSIACRVCPEYALRYLFDGMACQDYEAMEKSRKKKLNAYLARKIASIEGVMDLECRRVNPDGAGGSSLQAILKSHRQPRFDEIKQYTDHVKSLYMYGSDHLR